MTTFDFMSGDHDYRAAAEQKTVADLETQVNTVMESHANLQARYVVRTEAYDRLVADVLAKIAEFRAQGNVYFAEQLEGVLDGHFKEQS